MCGMITTSRENHDLLQDQRIYTYAPLNTMLFLFLHDPLACFESIFILQIYRVSDMELVRVLPSAEDEVNVACFHPSVGGGFVYGTKVKC